MYNVQIPQSIASKDFSARQVARYGRLSSQQQDGIAKLRQVFDLNKAAEMVGPLREELLFFDIESGRSDEREGFQSVLHLIRANELDALVIINLKRLGRELGTLVDLWEFFSSHQCELFIIHWGKFVDFSRYSQDYERFVDDSVVAAKESRTIGWRAFRAWEWARYQKRSPYRVPFGFIRTDEGMYQKDPKTEAIAAELCKGFFDKGCPWYQSFSKAQQWLEDAHGIKKAERWARRWFTHPAVRGDTKYGATDEIIENTHVGYISREQFGEVEKVINANKRNRGFVKQKYPLSGICFCGACGNKMFAHNNKKRGIKYLVCKGKTYPKKGTEKCTVATYSRYDWVEEELIKQLCAKADDVGRNAQKKPEAKPSPEIDKINANIKEVRQLIQKIGDPSGALWARVIEMEEEILRLTPSKDAGVISQSTRDLIELAIDPEFWSDANDEERRIYYGILTRRIVVFQDRVEVDWKI